MSIQQEPHFNRKEKVTEEVTHAAEKLVQWDY